MGGATVSIGNNGANTAYGGGLTNGAPVKIGGGTLTLSGTNTCSGDTRVEAGTLALAGSSTIRDSTSLWIASGAMVDLAAGVNEAVTKLYLNGSVAYVGTWGSNSSAADHKDDRYFTSTGILTVLDGPIKLDGIMLIIK